MKLNEIKKFFDEYANKYYEQRVIKGGRLFNEYIEMPTTKSLLGRKINSKTSVLDIGSGIGSYSKFYGNLGARVTSIDISSNMISIGKKLCQNLKNVEFINASFEEIDLETLKFDYIIGGFMLSYFQDLDFAFSKISRHLKPNGVVVLSMLHPVKLSVNSESNGNFCFSNYFDENEYVTDLNFQDDYINIKKWNIEDVMESTKKADLFIDTIKEPRPDIPANLKIENSDKFFSCPSIIVFRIKKRK